MDSPQGDSGTLQAGPRTLSGTHLYPIRQLNLMLEKGKTGTLVPARGGEACVPEEIPQSSNNVKRIGAKAVMDGGHILTRSSELTGF